MSTQSHFPLLLALSCIVTVSSSIAVYWVQEVRYNREKSSTTTEIASIKAELEKTKAELSKELDLGQARNAQLVQADQEKKELNDTLQNTRQERQKLNDQLYDANQQILFSNQRNKELENQVAQLKQDNGIFAGCVGEMQNVFQSLGILTALGPTAKASWPAAFASLALVAPSASQLYNSWNNGGNCQKSQLLVEQYFQNRN